MNAEAQYGAWHPGLESRVPGEWRHLATIFRPENVFTTLPAALEVRSLTGLALSEIVAFRPARLMLHELLIRVMADFEVPDGSRIGDLGINFRIIARRLLERHLQPAMPQIATRYAWARERLAGHLDTLIGRLGRNWGPAQIAVLESAAASDAAEQCASRTLVRVLSRLFATQGCAWGTHELIAGIALDLACNDLGSRAVGEAIEPLLLEAARIEGYALLPAQAHPTVINTKGASASGKSSLRPMQKKLAGDIGVRWGDFALISPDIWRKQLLDYGSLGEAYKYAGAFTAEELQIVDHKLDRYMSRKHRRGVMSHLLIDRFRFDSFAPDSLEAGSNLLTRFGQNIHLFFVITPPELLVERAWARGLEFGRYKAVDDTLAHAVEAYSGIPDVFFTWVKRTDKRLRYEFLDNTVARGERPRTVAFGDAGSLNLLDLGCALQMRRYARIDVNALEPQAVYPSGERQVGPAHADFLIRCLATFPAVQVAQQSTGRIYLRFERGVPVFVDDAALTDARRSAESQVALTALLAGKRLPAVSAGGRYLQDGATAPTLGQWGWTV